MRLTENVVVVGLMAIISLVLLPMSTQPLLAAVQPTGRVTGAVMDFNGAVIVTPMPTIIINGEQTTQKVVADENGSYQVELPAGLYQIHAELPGFYPFRRAAFRVQPATTTMINIVPMPRYLVRGTTVSPSASIDVLAPTPMYDSIKLARSPISPSALIAFRRKNARKGSVKYDGATLSYDVLTIYADQIRYNKRERHLEATGERIIVEDGKQRVQVKCAKIKFKAGEPIIELTP